MPKNTLQAIAFTESGQYFKGKGMIAWPWIINVQGRGYLFPTKEKAVQAAELLVKSGRTNFDIGCMQINYKHHGAAFNTLHDAFSPQKNIDYAGRFLKSLFDKNKSWKLAQAHYHSGNPKLHTPYLKLVEKQLKKITDTKTYTMPLNIENLIHARKELKTRFQQSENIQWLSLEKTVKSIAETDTPYNSILQTRSINTKRLQRLNKLTIASKRYTPDGKPYADKNSTNMKNGIVKIIRYK